MEGYYEENGVLVKVDADGKEHRPDPNLEKGNAEKPVETTTTGNMEGQEKAMSQPVENEAEKEEKKGILRRLLEALRALYDSLHKNSAFSVFQEEIMKDMTALQFQSEINSELLSDITDRLNRIDGLAKLHGEEFEQATKQLSDFINENTEMACLLDPATGVTQYVLFDRVQISDALMQAGIEGKAINLNDYMMFIEADKDGNARLSSVKSFDELLQQYKTDIGANEKTDVARRGYSSLNFTMDDLQYLCNNANTFEKFRDMPVEDKKSWFDLCLKLDYEKVSNEMAEAKAWLKEANDAVKKGLDISKVDVNFERFDENSKNVNKYLDEVALQKKLTEALEKKNLEINKQNLERERKQLEQEEANRKLYLEREKERIKNLEEFNSQIAKGASKMALMFGNVALADIVKNATELPKYPNANKTAESFRKLFPNSDRKIEELFKDMMSKIKVKDGEILEDFKMMTKLTNAEGKEMPFTVSYKKGQDLDFMLAEMDNYHSKGIGHLLEKALTDMEKEQTVSRETIKEEMENTTRPYNDFGVDTTKGDKVYVDDERGNIHQFNTKETATDFKEEKKEENQIEEKEEKEEEGRQ